MSKFKIGDKVRILDGSKINEYTGGWNKIDMSKHIGEVHEIIDIHKTWGDSPCAAYTLDFEGSCKFYKWDERGLELANDQKIVITTDGKTTTAVLYEGKQRIREAKAVCAPSDEFNFKYSAALALSRLNDDKTNFGKHADKTYVDEFAKDEYFTGKARCIRVDPRQTTWLTKGKIYEFVNGHSVDDIGEQLPLVTQIHSIKELNKILYSDFEEVVEKSQMDRFIDGEIYLEVPKEKIKSFLEECERINLRWASGDNATQFGDDKKYFKVLLNHLTYSKKRISTEPWEIWDGTKATEKIETKPDDGVFDILKVMAKLVAFTELMKDDLDD